MENLEDIALELRGMQGAVTEVLRDTLGDYKEREASRNRRDLRKDVTIWLLIVALVGSFFYYQWSFKNFMSEFEYETTYETYSEVDGSDGGNAINNGGNIGN